jgi:hypothetical protein
MVDDPKPAIVPTISEKKPFIMNIMSVASTLKSTLIGKLSVGLH